MRYNYNGTDGQTRAGLLNLENEEDALDAQEDLARSIRYLGDSIYDGLNNIAMAYLDKRSSNVNINIQLPSDCTPNKIKEIVYQIQNIVEDSN